MAFPVMECRFTANIYNSCGNEQLIGIHICQFIHTIKYSIEYQKMKQKVA